MVAIATNLLMSNGLVCEIPVDRCFSEGAGLRTSFVVVYVPSNATDAGVSSFLQPANRAIVTNMVSRMVVCFVFMIPILLVDKQ